MQVSHDDVVESVAAALQYISYYHPPDFLRALASAYRQERSAPARDAIGQILENSRMCAEGLRPICQDTGIVNVFVRLGIETRLVGFTHGLEAAINEAVARAYRHPDNPLRASIVSDPLGARLGTGDNAPAVIHVALAPGAGLSIHVMAKGGGGENKAKFEVLMPSDSLVDWVVATVPKLGAGWCPPGILGIGAGGTPEKAMLLAKESLLEPVDMPELRARGPRDRLEELRLRIHDAVNALGIGAQGLGGLTTVLDVKIRQYPTHASSLPVALIPNCAATRHAHLRFDGQGPVFLDPPSLGDWPRLTRAADASDSLRVDLDRLTPEQVRAWRAGQRLLLSGRMLTGRDAAHQRIQDMLARGEPLPVQLRGRVLYYVGPVDAVRDEVVGPAGPTTSTRMDKFSDMMLGGLGLLATIGKAERGPAAIEAIRRHGSAYLAATGGAAYLVARAIRSARVLAFADLGMEAIHEFEVRDMPVVVAVDATGDSVHDSGPRLWQRLQHRQNPMLNPLEET
ncbi:MAG TPA: fumarate hydratase [Ramlibacter sp.]|nr:fumarate hydratase [Ramlibacter sp.]